MKQPWTQKYKPDSIDEYIGSQTFKKQMRTWVEDGASPHLLLYGPPGTGKTTAAHVLMNELDIHKFDRKIINASNADQAGVKFIRDVLEDFCSTVPMGTFKYVLLDEADYLSHSSMAILRHLIEANEAQCRFILTANYINRIQPALKSRCFKAEIDKMGKNEFSEHVVKILINEGVEFSVDDVGFFIDSYYPDLRECLTSLQNNVDDRKLVSPSSSTETTNSDDWRLKAIVLFRDKKFVEARNLICSQLSEDEVDDLFTLLYNNVDVWANDDVNKQREAIICIRNGLANVPMVADQEINVSATLCELELIANG